MDSRILAYYCFIYHLLQICLPHYWQVRDLVHDSFISGNVSSLYTDGVYRASVRGDLFKNTRSAMSKTCRRHCSLLWTEEISFLGWFWGVCIHKAWKTEAIYYCFVCSNTQLILYVECKFSFVDTSCLSCCHGNKLHLCWNSTKI